MSRQTNYVTLEDKAKEIISELRSAFSDPYLSEKVANTLEELLNKVKKKR